MPSELQYFDFGDDGMLSEDRKLQQIPRWRQTQTQFQVDVLDIFGMKYFPKEDRDAKKDLIEIERGLTPLSALPNLNKILQDERTGMPYPLEWVQFGISWTKNKRREGVPIQLRGLINFLKNRDRMINWLEKNKMFVYTPEKKYETRKEIMEDTHARLETNYADYGD
jgi:hypothetical protein